MTAWIEQLRTLGGAFIEVLRAEVEALRADVSLSARRLGVALALFGLAAVVAFWLIGVLLFALVAVLAIWLPVWGASLVLVLLLLLITAGIAWAAMRKLRAFEGPASTVRRRLADHLAWWQASLLREERPIVPGRTVAGGPPPGTPPGATPDNLGRD